MFFCEVERLYDYLFNLFNENKVLIFKDIIVMMLDVGIYSLYIEVVFGGVEGWCFIFYVLVDLVIE